MNQKNKKSELTKGEKTAQDFINVADIRDGKLYTKDGYIFMYIAVTPIVRDLLTQKEQFSLCDRIIAQLSSETKPFKLFNLQKPVDVSDITSQLSKIKREDISDVRKLLLSLEIAHLDKEATSNTTAECQFFVAIWDKIGQEDALFGRAKDMEGKYLDSSMQAEIVDTKGIINICSLYTNPAIAQMETNDFQEPLLSTIIREGDSI